MCLRYVHPATPPIGIDQIAMTIRSFEPQPGVPMPTWLAWVSTIRRNALPDDVQCSVLAQRKPLTTQKSGECRAITDGMVHAVGRQNWIHRV